jgi:hypothetical protein
MIAGIIWKVEALPTPVAKNSARKLAKKPVKAGLSRSRSRPAHAGDHADEDPEGDAPATPAVGDPAGAERG